MLVDIRDFAIADSGAAPEARVELLAKLVGADGSLIGSSAFPATEPVNAMEGGVAAAALDRAFEQAAQNLVEWTAATLNAAPEAAPEFMPPDTAPAPLDAEPAPMATEPPPMAEEPAPAAAP